MEKILEFDKRGYLQPSEAIELTLSDFRDTFVVNTRREHLFDAYLNFMEVLKNNQINYLYQWINGSFASKKLYPKDIDIVIFLDKDTYEKQMDVLQTLKYSVRPEVDAYFVKVYEKDSDAFNIYTRSDILTWHHLFAKDRSNAAKGYVQINF